jgi:uncharacterized protein with HEPN domain
MKMSKRDPRVYVEDIRDSIIRITEYTKGGSRMFFKDGKTQDAVIRQLSIIGEAASKLPAALKSKYPIIPWKNIIGLRNIIVHDYSDVNLETIWDVVENNLPDLKKAIMTILKTLPKE